MSSITVNNTNNNTHNKKKGKAKANLQQPKKTYKYKDDNGNNEVINNGKDIKGTVNKKKKETNNENINDWIYLDSEDIKDIVPHKKTYQTPYKTQNKEQNFKKNNYITGIIIPSPIHLSTVWSSLMNEDKTNYELNSQQNKDLSEKDMDKYFNMLKFVTKCCNVSSAVIENLNSNITCSFIASIDTLFTSNKVLLILTCDKENHKTLFTFKNSDMQYVSQRLINSNCEKIDNINKSNNQLNQYKLKIVNYAHKKKTETIITFKSQLERDFLTININ